jgi:voltage-gated potassium channel
MDSPPRETPARPRASRIDIHWLHSLLFTIVLVGLVGAALGTEWILTLVMVASACIGLGFFYLLFPGGAHFGMTVANFLAIYACLFEFFRDANFAATPRPIAALAQALPVAGFLVACFLRRRRVFGLIRARRTRELNHLPRLTRWFVLTMAVGAASFALPSLDPSPAGQGAALLAAMGLITVIIVLAVRDVILVMVDVATVFEDVAARLDRLVLPMMAFLTFYALLIVIFACLYRIVDLMTSLPQFTLHGVPNRLSFTAALYYSIAAITTLGFGDIAPVSPLVRVLSGMEVVCGVLMLLFGFSEIMRSAGASGHRPE